MSDRFLFINDNSFGPRICDRKTGRWMGLDLAKEYAAVVNAAVKSEARKAKRIAKANPTAPGSTTK